MDIKFIIALVILTIGYIAALCMPVVDIKEHRLFKRGVGVSISIAWVGTLLIGVL